MKMKKILAAVSALTIVGANLGLAVFAEEAAVTTENSAVISEEAVSTEPVIAEEAAAETTEAATEETTEAAEVTADETTETATETDEVVEAEAEDFENLGTTLDESDGIVRSATVTIGDKKFIIKNEDGLVENDFYPVKMYLSVYFEDGTATNLQNIVVVEDVSFGGSPDGHNFVYTVTNHFAVANDILTIKSKVNGNIDYKFDNETNSFVKLGFSPEDDTPEVTEEMLYDKFVSEYREPSEFTFGDFNNDGKPDAFAYLAENADYYVCYFVTADGISIVSSDRIFANSYPTYYYFNVGSDSFKVTFYLGGSMDFLQREISINKIKYNGTLAPCTINGKENILVCYDEYQKGVDFNSALTPEQVDEASTFIKSNGDYITITVYDFENGIIGASTNYVFDSESNNFVVGKTPNGGSQGGSQGGSAGSSGTVTNSPATSDSMSIPAVAASAAIVLGSVIYVSKKRK